MEGPEFSVSSLPLPLVMLASSLSNVVCSTRLHSSLRKSHKGDKASVFS